MGESGTAAGAERQKPVTLTRPRRVYGLGGTMFAALFQFCSSMEQISQVLNEIHSILANIQPRPDTWESI